VREEELREKGNCGICGKGIGASGIIFYRLRLEQYVVNMGALQRQQGLTMMMGGHALLAQVMGPDEEMAKEMQTGEMTVCADCIGEPHLALRLLEPEGKVKPPEEAS